MLSHKIIPFLAFALLAVGFLAFAANPRRRVNIAFLTLSIQAALWLALRYAAISTSSLTLFRVTVSVGTIWFPHLLVIVELIIRHNDDFFRILKRLKFWLIGSVVLAVLPFTEFFVSSTAAKVNTTYGVGYHFYVAITIILYVLLFLRALRAKRTLKNPQRLELEIVTKGAIYCAILIIVQMGLAGIFEIHFPLQPFLVPAFFAWTIYLITTRRILNARQILLSSFKKVLFLFTIVSVAFLLFLLFRLLPLNIYAVFMLAVIATSFAMMLITPKLDRFFSLAPDLSKVRQEVFNVSRLETDINNLSRSFSLVLKEWLSIPEAFILWGTRAEIIQNKESRLTKDLLDAMRHYRWVTPELMDRTRRDPKAEIIADFLCKNALGVAILAEGPNHCIFLGASEMKSGHVYTYPLVQELVELADIMNNIFERSYYLAKARESAQLASIGLIGATVAHEIRNPLVGIKTFIQLLESNDSPELRSRFSETIKSELARIDRLTDQLLNLSRPRRYVAKQVVADELIEEIVLLASGEAKERQVELHAEAAKDCTVFWTDPDAVKQVVLNLLKNAFDAVAEKEGTRQVTILSRTVDDSFELDVSDNGGGIAPDLRSSLFQPFKTTKDSGFGLGLVICKDILNNINASIRLVDTPASSGATFRINFPLSRSTFTNQQFESDMSDFDLRLPHFEADIEMKPRRLRSLPAY